MFKRFFYVNFLMLIIFLLTAVFPQGLFPYSYCPDDKDEWVDESYNNTIPTYKKVRCPNCSMEFYYIPGKEGLYCQWVRYEVSSADKKALRYDSKDRGEGQEEELTKENKLLDLFMIKKDAKDILAEQQKIEAVSEQKDSKIKYELRQKLTCPYDGYNFFPEGDIIERGKILQQAIFQEESSSIESSFEKFIPFMVSGDLKQFGYDLFKRGEEQREEKEKKEEAREKPVETLTALSMLKTSSTGGFQSPIFSSGAGAISETAVVPVGPDYVIGPGDTLIINIWGSVQESFPVSVDREGKIMLPKAGPLYIWGLKFKDAEDRIREKLNEYYTNFNVDISMGKLRGIQVFVMGEVTKPGTYLINSQSNIFQALYAAGGPTKLGSLRKIKIISSDSKEREMDIYPFLLKGKALENSRIQSGDTIFIPPIGDVVAIAGNVKRPAIYETKSMLLLGDLFDFAGGISPTGNLHRLQVERIKDNERRVMLDIELKATQEGENALKYFSLRNGDLVIVAPIVRLKHNFITVLGNVETPGDYALKEDMTVSNLIERAKGFLPATYLYRAEIARVSKDRTRQIIPINLDRMLLGDKNEDILLKEWDILLIYSEAEVQPPSFVEIDGAVNKPGKYELTPGMKVSDLVFKAGNVTPNDFIREAELFHIMPGEQPVVREIGIKRISGPNISIDKDIILQPGDVLFVKSEPKLTEKRMVTIKGEVRFPGTYPIIEGERLSSLIERAGGFNREAFLEGAIFNRKSIKDVQEKMRQRFLEREQRTMLEEQQSILLRGGSISSTAVSESLKTRAEMLGVISQAEIEGRMVVKLMPTSQLKNSKYDILLEDGDILAIPRPSSAVTIIGSVNNPTSVPFDDGKGVDYYIQKTGGLTKHADKSGIYVVRANGEALSKFMMAKHIERGDTIVVPQSFRYWTPPGTLLKDTVEILSRIAIGVGIIAALD